MHDGDKVMLLIFSPALVWIMAARLRTYARTGLKGDLLVGIGSGVLVLSFAIANMLVAIIGFVAVNVGFAMLATVEYEKRREIFRQTSVWDRLIGNVPEIKPRDGSDTVPSNASLATGLACIVLGIAYLLRSKGNVVEEVFGVVMIGAGVWFVAFHFFGRRKK